MNSIIIKISFHNMQNLIIPPLLILNLYVEVIFIVYWNLKAICMALHG